MRFPSVYTMVNYRTEQITFFHLFSSTKEKLQLFQSRLCGGLCSYNPGYYWESTMHEVNLLSIFIRYLWYPFGRLYYNETNFSLIFHFVETILVFLFFIFQMEKASYFIKDYIVVNIILILITARYSFVSFIPVEDLLESVQQFRRKKLRFENLWFFE